MRALHSAALAALFTIVVGCSAKNAKVSSRNSVDFEDEIARENPPISEEEFEAQQRGEVPPQFDIPIVRNAKVEQWITYFQGRGRKWFGIWLERSGRYIPMMRKILNEHDLPEDLVYLAMIESGFSSRAYSRARAVGPWQFMKSTGRIYGLRANFWVDERRDPEKSSIAAARHLKDLYDQFQSWKLAAAAYNAGAGKVSRAIRRYRTEDFWELARGRYLKPETRHYVPKLIAAALIAKEPEKYGFTGIEYQDPLEYDKIVLKRPVNLIQLAEATRVELDDLLALNPELNHPVTPPEAVNYELRIPSGRSSDFVVALDSIYDGEQVQYMAHKVRKGDNLQKIAKIYRTSTEKISKMNGLSGQGRVRQGQVLLIPVPLDAKLASAPKRAESLKFVSEPGQRVHVVRRGETLLRIAKRYGVTVASIKEENNLRRSVIKPGRQLVIPTT
jgi:membrane-bound lytic murein transglycosylase D